MTEIIRKNPDEAAQWMMSREQSTLLQEGEKMKNESVKHVRYGTGRVAEVVQNHMVVLFDGEAGRKVFPYPKVFEGDMKLVNQELQEELMEELA